MSVSKWAAAVAAGGVLFWAAVIHAPSVAAAEQAPCALVTVAEVSDIVGYAMQPPDEAAAGAGICTYASIAMTQDAVASYAVVTADSLGQRRRYFAAQARLCANVAAGTPREAACKAFARLAQAATLDEYFLARTDDPDATPVDGLGVHAIATSQALFVRIAGRVIECVVQRDETFDPARAQQLAKLVVQRVND